MFSLIITIISIALVAVLALATLYYGGKSFLKGRADAVASTVVNQGQQVSGAYTLYGTEHDGAIPLFADLVSSKYLKAVPQLGSTAWRPLVDGQGVLWLPEAVSADACQAINKKLNKTDGIPAKPVDSWIRQCYGENGKFYVLWDAPGNSNISDVVSQAVAATKDSAGTTVPSNLSVAPIPTGTSSGSGGSGSNNWTTPPTGNLADAGNSNNTAALFSVSLDKINNKITTTSVSFSGASYVSNNGSPLVQVTLTCNDVNNPGAGFSYAIPSPTIAGNNVTLSTGDAYVDSYSASNCHEGTELTDLILHYANGDQKAYKYNLTVAGLATVAARPSDTALASIYDNVQVNLPIPSQAMSDAIANTSSTGVYGYRIPISVADASNYTLTQYSTIYFANCDVNDPISACEQREYTGGYLPDTGNMVPGYVYMGIFNNELDNMRNYGSTPINKSGYVKLTMTNNSNGQSRTIYKPFTFNTNTTNPPMGW